MQKEKYFYVMSYLPFGPHYMSWYNDTSECLFCSIFLSHFIDLQIQTPPCILRIIYFFSHVKKMIVILVEFSISYLFILFYFFPTPLTTLILSAQHQGRTAKRQVSLQFLGSVLGKDKSLPNLLWDQVIITEPLP